MLKHFAFSAKNETEETFDKLLSASHFDASTQDFAASHSITWRLFLFRKRPVLSA
jgi:hypothetical protein